MLMKRNFGRRYAVGAGKVYSLFYLIRQVLRNRAVLQAEILALRPGMDAVRALHASSESIGPSSNCFRNSNVSEEFRGVLDHLVESPKRYFRMSDCLQLEVFLPFLEFLAIGSV